MQHAFEAGIVAHPVVHGLDGKIDDLYQQPLSDFISARNTLAKSLSGEDAKRVGDGVEAEGGAQAIEPATES